MKSILNYKKNVSLKFKVFSSKNKEEDRFIVISKIFEKIDPKKFPVHKFVSETFYKNKISQKLNDIFEFYKNWFVVKVKRLSFFC